MNDRTRVDETRIIRRFRCLSMVDQTARVYYIGTALSLLFLSRQTALGFVGA